MASDQLPEKNRSGEKKTDGGMLIIAVVLLTLVAGAGGWLLGSNIGEIVGLSSKLATAAASGKAQVDVVMSDSDVTVLPPILTNMVSPSTAWIRMESALVAKPQEKISAAVAAEITSDFLAYLRNSSLARIKGPTGFMYLREDLLERANIRSGGKVSHVLISGLVIEQ